MRTCADQSTPYLYEETSSGRLTMSRPLNSQLAPDFVKYPDHKMILSTPTVIATATIKGLTLATSKKAIQLSEANYADAIYFPRSDVNMNQLVANDTTSFCPFKGTAHYWSLLGSTKNTHENIDICWSYEDPFIEASAIGTYIAFYSDKVTVTYCQH